MNLEIICCYGVERTLVRLYVFLVAKLEALKGNSLIWPQVIGLYEIIQEMNSFQVHMLQGIYTSYIQSLYWAYITMMSES